MTDESRYIIIARLGRPHGIKGGIIVHPITDGPAEHILQYQPWYIKKNQTEFMKISIEKHRSWNANKLIVYLPEVGTPEATKSYTGKSIYIQRDKLATLTDNEYYWSDLEGLSVINQSDEKFGKVSHLFRTGANDVLVVEGECRRLIPFLAHTIIRVEFDKQRIFVDWPSDL
jgi:16S rRNA processing protein RimM